MDTTTPRPLGRSGLRVTPLGFGAATISRPTVTDEVALATVREAWDRGVRFFDTAPWYGIGRSERRLGLALGALEARDEFLLNTKVGKWLVPEPVARREPQDAHARRLAPHPARRPQRLPHRIRVHLRRHPRAALRLAPAPRLGSG